MEHANDLDADRDCPIENPILLESRNGKEPKLGQGRMIVVVGRPHAGHVGQSTEQSLGLVAKPLGRRRATLADVVVGDIHQVQTGRIAADDTAHMPAWSRA